MTIKEIAQICGVSRGTVDRVVNHRGKVKPDTEALILRTIHRMGYTKNIAGKRSQSKRMRLCLERSCPARATRFLTM